MRPQLLAACLLTGTSLLPAQPRHLATDRTGSVLYFASNMTGEPNAAPGYSRIFRWEPRTGITVFIDEPQAEAGTAGRIRGVFGVDSPSVSADGERVAYMSHVDCVGCERFPMAYAFATVTDRTRGRSFFETWGKEEPPPDRGSRVEISRNGRYVVWRAAQAQGFTNVYDITGPPVPRVYGNGVFAHDFPFSETGTRQMATDSGDVIFGLEGTLYHLTPLAFPPASPVAETVAAMAPVTSADGQTVVYETLPIDGRGRQLLALDRRTGKQWFLWMDPGVERTGLPLPLARGFGLRYFFTYPYPAIEGQMFSASMDEHGRKLVILAREEAGEPRRWLVEIPLNGGSPAWLVKAEEGFLEAVLSGDGKVVFAATANGRLIRVDVASGETAELLGPTPWIASLKGAVKRGARNRIEGGGFAPTARDSPSQEGVEELGGVRVEWNGHAMPLFRVSPSEIIYRIPAGFEIPSSAFTVRVRAPSASGFHPLALAWRAPLVVPVEVEPPGAIGEDGEPISLARPPRPGESIAVFSTGWDDGKPPVQCRIVASFGEPLPVFSLQILSFGPASGMPGVSDLRIRIPEGIANTESPIGTLTCHDGVPLGGALGLPMALHRQER